MYDEEGALLHPFVRKRQRFALLIYLTVDGGQAPHTRDDLMAMFWPESNPSRAANCLRQGLHVIRGELGDVLVSRGSMVGLRPWAIGCDAVSFSEAWAAGKPRVAASHYGGDFLPGFHIPDAWEFDDWVESTRKVLRRQAMRAFLSLAERARERGQPAVVLRWLIEAAELAPFDERLHRMRLRAHVALGDRGGALSAHGTFRRRLERDLEVAPSPETEAFVAELRNGSRGAHSGREDRGGYGSGAPANP